jgi:predicted acetyltransferase
MTVSLRDARVHAADREWIEGVYRDYLDDLRAHRTGLFPVLGAVGLSEPDQVQAWLADRHASLFTILEHGQPAGFALMVREPAAAGVDYRLAEFFIARPARRRGIGRGAARLIFDRFAGRWLVKQDATNREATAFWRNVLAGYTRGDYRERTGDGEVRQSFSSTNSKKG